MTDLTSGERALLDQAGLRYRHVGNAEQAIRERFGISATAFWQKVNRLLDDPRAEAERPATVRRLRRLRDRRRALR